MARKRQEDSLQEDYVSLGDLDVYQELKSVINRRIPNSAFILGDDNAPTDVKQWISLGSYQLDTIISNKAEYGGAPVGRITEISGLESSGKSLLAIEACKDTQRQGGIAVYIDTENGTSIEWLTNMGVDPKRLVYVQVPTTEEVFQTVESIVDHIIEKQKKLGKKEKRLITVIWDSVAQTSTQAEFEGGYDDMQMASQAKVIGKGIRKITQYLGASNVCFIVLNQLKMLLNLKNPYQDPWTTPGGKALHYACSVRIRLTRKTKIEGDGGAIIGFETEAKLMKNKVGPPARSAAFDIYFNSGVSDDEQALDFLKKKQLVEIVSVQKSALILENGERVEFKNRDWDEVVPHHSAYIEKIIRKALVVNMTNPENISREKFSEDDSARVPDNAEIDPDTGEILAKAIPKKDKKKKEEVTIDDTI